MNSQAHVRNVRMTTFEDVVRARETIHNSIKKTPLVRSEFLSDLSSGDFYLKLENLQVTNSFKIRGALNRILNLSDEEKKRGIVTASAGNHAQAVAIGAVKLNLAAKIVIPTTTPKVKVEKIKRHKADLILFGNTYDETENEAIKIANEQGLTYIPAYNDDLVIAGQGTIALEILEDLPNVEMIIVPVGGGGLISGISMTAKTAKATI